MGGGGNSCHSVSEPYSSKVKFQEVEPPGLAFGTRQYAGFVVVVVVVVLGFELGLTLARKPLYHLSHPISLTR
jgi:hypothetical protein